MVEDINSSLLLLKLVDIEFKEGLKHKSEVTFLVKFGVVDEGDH